jgi:hypothetical protein
MGKSYNRNKDNFSENNRNKSNDYKRRKNQIREEHTHDELSEYKIHGFKPEKNS